jgi:hypothetical protein
MPVGEDLIEDSGWAWLLLSATKVNARLAGNARYTSGVRMWIGGAQ